MRDEKEEFSEEEAEKALKGTTLFFVSIFFIISISALFFYSTVRAKCMGLATGYIKAIEFNYQTGAYKPLKENMEDSFETGIYKIKVGVITSKDEGGITIKVSVKDKFTSITHYSEEMKIIPIPEVSE
ncbi:MAG: hypothetical protein U0457_15915 [Candidatus Sericytochromatia bacterium]